MREYTNKFDVQSDRVYVKDLPKKVCEEVEDIGTEWLADWWHEAKDDYLGESINLTEDTHLVNSYYVVDIDNEIIADNVTRAEAKNIVKEVKDTFNDYIYVTKTSIYDTNFGRQTDYEDIVDVNRFNDGLTITKDVFKIFVKNEDLVQTDNDSQDPEMEQAKNISHLIFDNYYGNKSVEELDVDSINDIDHYYTLIRDVDEAERFNYHSDHWGYDEDYQEQNIDLIDNLTPYINKQVEIDYEDGTITGKLLGIAIDRQYNSINHTKVILDAIEELNEALAQAETEEEKAEIEQQIEEVDNKIDYADDHGLAKDHLIDEMDALNEDINWSNVNLLRNDTDPNYIDYPLPKESDFQNLKNRIKHNANTFYYLYIDIDDVNNAENHVYPAVAYTYIGEDDNSDMADIYGVITADILSTGEIIEDGWYDLNNLEFDLLDIIKDNLPSINEYKINIGELNIKNSDQNSVNEEVESYIYLFPLLSYEDLDELDNFNLTYVGKNRFEDEVNSVVKGSKADLEKYAAEYLDYQLHPDYLYVEADFAGDIEKDVFEAFNESGDVDFTVETPNKLTIDEIKEIAMEHYEDGGDIVIETMTDDDIQKWIESDGTLDGLMKMFRINLDIYQDRKAREYDDAHYVPEVEQPEEAAEVEVNIWDDEDPMLPDEYERDDDISDFGPGNPWDAPGMSVKDFLR